MLNYEECLLADALFNVRGAKQELAGLVRDLELAEEGGEAAAGGERGTAGDIVGSCVSSFEYGLEGSGA